jgi:hypothetical protein
VRTAEAQRPLSRHVPGREAARGAATFRREPSARTAFICIVGIFVFSTALRIALGFRVHAPTVFSDEIGYQKLAQSIGRTGRLALFNEEGLSYSPLYSLVLSPIYALGASASSAYSLTKIVNAVLISLAIFPTYKIARFILPRRSSLLVAGLSPLAPLMTYSSFTVSENLAYPLCLLAIWAMLHAVRAPSIRSDALLVGAVVLATAARTQLIVLVPAALTAVVLAAVVRRNAGETLRRSLVRPAREHGLLSALLVGGLLVGATATVAGHDVLSAFGRYAVVFRAGFPNTWHLLNLFVQHLAGIDLAVGVVPFVGALVAGFVFIRSRPRAEHVVFAAVAVAMTAWLLVEVALDAALFDAPRGSDIPRIHERFVIYVLPLFLVALFAALRIPESRAPARVWFAAAAITALLPLVIPFHTVVNNTVNYESFGLHMFSRVGPGGQLVAVPHAALFAIWLAGTLSLLFVYVRKRLRAVLTLLLIVSILVSTIAQRRVQDGGDIARSLLPRHADWVDRAGPAADVILISSGRHPTAELETAYHNLSISRVYNVCSGAFGPEFGEETLTIDEARRLRGPSGHLTARYVVARTSLGLRGHVVARNANGHEVLVAPPPGPLTVSPRKHVCG